MAKILILGNFISVCYCLASTQKRENDRCKTQSHHYFDMQNVKLSNHNVGCKTRKQLFIVAWGDT